MNERSLFLAALDKTDAAQRGAFLDEACRDDDALRRRMDKLLRAHRPEDSFLEQPPGDVMTTVDAVAERPGTVVGPYKLLEQIGEGGFGVVFLAEQTQPVRRQVALKVLKPGMDTRQVVARFEAERQALALMDHPNIARVLDGGATTSGRPYFVMELVKGVPITEFSDQHRLTPRQRLELFVSVCQAVQHAHQKGIIHRDIKPSNVLVTVHDATPAPKVIDFGIAKALGQQLTDKTLFTGVAQMVGTPLYMSPEQAGQSGLDVDTRSDVYALGVLLYELLTGTTPFDKERLGKADHDEMRRIIREEEPAKPSTRFSTLGWAVDTVSVNRQSDPQRLSRLVRGELDWVVMRALEKDRNRRYETVGAFAADVQRYLADEPVQACPPSVGYRLRKLVWRNKGPVVGASLVVLSLVGGIMGTTWGMFRADHARQDAVAAQSAEAERAAGERRAKEDAQTRLAQIEKGTELLAAVFRDLNPIAAKKAGVTSSDLLGRRLSEAAQQLEGEAVGDPLVVARLQHLLGISLRELGHLKQAEDVLVKACRTRERLLAPDDLDTVATKHHLAVLYRYQSKHALAEALFNEVRAIRTAQLGADDLDTLATKHHLAGLYFSQQKYALAEELLRKVVAGRTARLGADDLDTLASKHKLAVVYGYQGKYAPAEALLQEVRAIRTARLGADHPDTLRTLHHLALLYRSQEKVDLAEALLREVVAGRTAKLEGDHPDTISSQNHLASLYADQGKFALAETMYKELLAVRTAKLGADHIVTILSRDGLADVYWSMKQFDQSIPLLEESLKLRKAQLDPDDPEILGRQVTLGGAYCDAGRFADGMALIEEVRQKGRQDPHPAWVRSVLLKAYVQAGKTTEATALVMERVRDARQQFPADSPQLAAALADNGKLLLDAKAYAAAEPLLRESLSFGKDQGSRTTALELLVQLYDAWDKPDEAAKWRKELEKAKEKQ